LSRPNCFIYDSCSSVYASICGNGIRIATVAASTPIFVQGLGNSVQCLAYHHGKGLLAYCEGFSGLSPPRVFVLQFNDQLLSSANLACVGVLVSRAHDNSLVGLKFSHDGVHLIALSAIGSSSVIIWNVSSASIIASADFEGLQSNIVVLPSPSMLKFVSFGSCCADLWSVHTDMPGEIGSITKQSIDVSRLDDGDYITCASWLSRYCLVAGLHSGKVFVIDVQQYVLRSRSPTFQDVGSGICCLITCTNHIVVGCTDGSIRFLYHEGTSAHTETLPFSSGYIPPLPHKPKPSLQSYFYLVLSPLTLFICSYSVPAVGSSVVSMSPSQGMDSMLVACADGRLLAIVIPSDLLLSDKDGWAGELELADVTRVHTGRVLQVAAVGGEGTAVSIDPSGVVLVWSLLSGQCVASLNMFVAAPNVEEEATSLAVCGRGRLVAVGFRSGGFAVFDLSTLTNRKCVSWSRLDTTRVVAVAAHPIHPVFCVAFASNYVVFVSVTAAAASVIGRTTTDVPIHSVHWIDSGSPGHVVLVLRDASILRLTAPDHSTPHSIHCTEPMETFDPRRVRLSAIVAGFTGDVSVVACRLVIELSPDPNRIGVDWSVAGAEARLQKQAQAQHAWLCRRPQKTLRCVFLRMNCGRISHCT
jgi:WD40 repeat protein